MNKLNQVKDYYEQNKEDVNQLFKYSVVALIGGAVAASIFSKRLDSTLRTLEESRRLNRYLADRCDQQLFLIDCLTFKKK